MNLRANMGLPRLGTGLAYRTELTPLMDQYPEAIDWLEVTSDQFLPQSEARDSVLESLARDRTLVPHSLDLSIASLAEPDRAYSGRVTDLATRIDAPWFSDHLALTRLARKKLSYFVPPYRDQLAVDRIARRCAELQDAAQRPFLLENISTLIEPGGPIPEPEFIGRIAEAADCGVLLDLANLYARCCALGLDIYEWLARLPLERVVQVHIAGGKWDDGFLKDTHDAPVMDEVWSLLEYVRARTDLNSVLLERDGDYPEDMREIALELKRASNIMDRRVSAPTSSLTAAVGVPEGARTLVRLDVSSQHEFECALEAGAPDDPGPSRSERTDGFHDFIVESDLKRVEYIRTTFPSTFEWLSQQHVDGEQGVLLEFSASCPRLVSSEDALGTRESEAGAFRAFAEGSRSMRFGAFRDLLRLEWETAQTLMGDTSPASVQVDCECVLNASRFDPCEKARVELSPRSFVFTSCFDIPGLRHTLERREAFLLPAPGRRRNWLFALDVDGFVRTFELGNFEYDFLSAIAQTDQLDLGSRGQTILARAYSVGALVINHDHRALEIVR